MNEIPKCAECGSALPANMPAGLCPACLLRQGLAANTAGFTREKPSGDLRQGAQWNPPSIEQLSDKFPELELLRLIGRGGMGAVYQARQKNLDRIVALKILPPEMAEDSAFAERFSREAQAMARLNHPHIVTIHDFGQRGGLYFFVMEYVDGLNLRSVLDSGHVAAKEALAIVPQICDALQYAHDNGIVHRDIKPENILLNKKGQVKIADFGLAKLIGRASEHLVGTPEKVIGTPQYMAPEQISRPSEVDHRADIYALGVVFYQMLTGELPDKQIQPPSRKVQIDVRLDEIVLRALEKEPELRFQNATIFKTQVETIATSAENRAQNQSAVNAIPYQPLQPAWAGFEYKSPQTLFGLPLLHVVNGFDPDTQKPRHARGIIAVGNSATGVIAMGGRATGLFAFGGIALGGFVIGGIGAGIVSFSGLALGLVAAVGGLAVAPFAVGGLAAGYMAIAGQGYGSQILDSSHRNPSVLRNFADKYLVNITVVSWLFWGAFLVAFLAIQSWARKKSTSTIHSTPPGEKGRKRFGSTLVKIPIAIAIILAIRAWIISPYTVTGNSAGPELPQGSKILVWKLTASLSPGDMIAYRSGNVINVGRVRAAKDQSIEVNRNGTPAFSIARSDLVGKVISVYWRASGNELPAAESVQAFAPSIECVIPFEHCIDFQTGIVRRIPQLGEFNNQERFETWFKGQGLDAAAQEKPDNAVSPGGDSGFPRLTNLFGSSCSFVRESVEFDNVHAGDADNRLQVTSRQYNVSWSLASGQGVWWFQTQDGAKGVLEILGPSESPSGLKLRYKLVQAGAAQENTAEVELRRAAEQARLESELRQHTLELERLSTSMRQDSPAIQKQQKEIAELEMQLKSLPAITSPRGLAALEHARSLERENYEQTLTKLIDEERQLSTKLGSRNEAVVVLRRKIDLVRSRIKSIPFPPIFGTQFERTIAADDANADGVVGYRFKDNNIVKPPAEITAHFRNPKTAGVNATLKEWMRAANVDMVFAFHDKSYETITLDMRDGFIGHSREWNTLLPAQAFPALKRQEELNTIPGPNTTSGSSYTDGPGSVNVFRTRDGIVGYYQLRSFADIVGHGVHIRSRPILTSEEKSPDAPLGSSALEKPLEFEIQGNDSSPWAWNLTTGKRVTSTQELPLDFTNSREGTLRDAGVDLYQAKDFPTTLIALDMRLCVSINEADGQPAKVKLEEMSADQVLETIKRMTTWRQTMETSVPKDVNLRNAMTHITADRAYVFVTRDGTRGVLVLRVVAGHAAKVVYRIVSKANE